MKTTECKCAHCGTLFQKPTAEYNRRIKANRVMYCCRSHAGLHNIKNFKDKVNRVPPPKGSRKMNPFRYYMRNCRRRDHELNIDIAYLEELWTNQQGICPYSGVQLILNNNSKRVMDFRYTASLDRIDSSNGYVKGNVQFVSASINLMKNSLTHNQTVEFLKQIANYRSSIS